VGCASLLGCAPGLEEPDRFTDGGCNLDVPTELLAPRCATSGCHSSFQPAAGMDLQSGNIGERLAGISATTCVSRPRIDPDNPEASYLLEVVSDEPDCEGTTVGMMPQVGAPLSDAERACLTEWVMEIAAEFPDRMGGGPRDAGTAPMDAGPEMDGGAGADGGADAGGDGG